MSFLNHKICKLKIQQLCVVQKNTLATLGLNFYITVFPPKYFSQFFSKSRNLIKDNGREIQEMQSLFKEASHWGSLHSYSARC